MPSRGLSPIHLLAALVAVVAAWVAACSADKQEQDAAPAAPFNVPLGWRRARLVAGHRVHVGEHQVACTSCHALAGSSMGDVSPARCKACHEREARIQHASSDARRRFGPEAKSDCTSCHAFAPPRAEQRADGGLAEPFAHAERVNAALSQPEADGGNTAVRTPAASDCLRCHQVARGSVPAVVVHNKGSDCLQCHQPHRDEKPEPARCSTCHETPSPAHAAHGGEDGCRGCHQKQHGRAVDALGSCQTCHADRNPIVPASALFAGGHTECVGCHRPHEFDKGLATPCRSCHEGVHVLGESQSAVHRQCTSCHNPHNVRGSPRFACAGCHTNVHPDHPKPAAAGGEPSCTGCHDPHPRGGTHGSAKACSSCHTVAKTETAFHKTTECVKCHTPHDFVMADGGKAVCHHCHEATFTAMGTNTGHQTCAGCHGGLPHQPASGQGKCATCHAKEHDDANRGHVTCNNCHEPHGGTVTAECKSCHKAEARTAPSGHANCLGCHEQHSGKPDRAACASCHANQAKTKHGQISADCANCHQPHAGAGPASPPPCATCHAKAKLPGLHSVAKHSECKNCHGGHDTPAATQRTPCLGCHADRQDHFPDAPRCTSCHLFD